MAASKPTSLGATIYVVYCLFLSELGVSILGSRLIPKALTFNLKKINLLVLYVKVILFLF